MLLHLDHSYRSADKSLARSRGKQVNVSVKMAFDI